MRRRLLYFLTSTLCCSLFADGSGTEVAENSEGEVAILVPEIFATSRADSLPVENFESATDPYLEGYIQSLVDMHYYEHRVLVSVKDHKVYLYNLPKNAMLADSIVAFVSDVPGVTSVEVKEQISHAESEARKKYTELPRLDGVWFPQSTVLFQPLIADPREPMYYVAYRGGDKVVGRKAAAVAMGDEFPIFRWRNVFRWKGDMQIGITAGIWAVFNFEDVRHHHKNQHCKRHGRNDEWAELINTDYMVGIALTYAFDRWSFRLRPYHISSHLGDELMYNRNDYVCGRRNPSFEAIDFFTSYQFSKGFRGYFGPGVIVHSDKSFPMKTFYVEYGAEIRMFGKKLSYHRLYGTPFFAVHLENWQVRNWTLDSTFKLGYELSKLQGVGRKMRIYVDYHQGFSYEGQFFKKRVKYGEVGLSWGW